jgi:hypothetical protein
MTGLALTTYPSILEINAGVLNIHYSLFTVHCSLMTNIGSWLKSLFSTNPIAPEIVRAKAYEMWKAQGGGIVDPDANWQAAIEQLQLQEKLTRRN